MEQLQNARKASLDARMKTDTGRGGQLNHHNVSYNGASWLTIANRALDSGLLRLSPEELATALFWELPIGITQLFNLLHNPRQNQSPTRWRTLSWNTGGLTAARLLEVETWLGLRHSRGQTIHVCVLLQTHSDTCTLNPKPQTRTALQPKKGLKKKTQTNPEP